MLPKNVGEYREPMVGGGSVYFLARNRELASQYWVNDRFHDLVAFWRTVQSPAHCAKLMRELEILRNSFTSAEQIKEYYLEARRESAASTYRKALLFFFFNRVTFSGTTKAGGFSSAASLMRFTASSIRRLEDMPRALDGTRVTELDFQEVIETPGEDVFLFLDPPYYTASKLYGPKGSLHHFDHERLAKALKNSEHRFLITYDDCQAVRRLYRWANITPWQLQYGMNNCSTAGDSKVGSELFISNY